jgi:rubrerythrin
LTPATKTGITLFPGWREARFVWPRASIISEETEAMSELKGTKTHQNLKDAFAGESQANRRYLYFAKVADVEGYPHVAGNFRETAEGETGHAHGHLDYLKKVGDPATDLPLGDTTLNLAAAVAGETFEYTDMYPGMAKTAREEGFDEIADWFETLAKAEKSHAGRFQSLLDDLS